MNSINNILADFQNLTCRILSSKIDVNNDINIEHSANYEYALDYEVISSKLEKLNFEDDTIDFNSGEIKLYLKIYDITTQKYKNPNFKNVIPFIEIISVGTFAGNTNVLNKETFDRMLVQNGLTYLSQFVRVHLLAITSTIGISGNISLPMINIIQFLQEHEKEKYKKK